MAVINKKHHTRTIDRIHLLVRLELANPMLSSTDIAKLCGLSIFRFSILKRSPYYQQVHNQYMTGICTDLDVAVKENLNMTQKTLDMAVPVAMQNLFKQAMQEKDLRVQNKACNDLLDRHGRFAKVTRVGLPTAEQGGVAEDKDNKAVNDMLKAIKAAEININTEPLTETTQ